MKLKNLKFLASELQGLLNLDPRLEFEEGVKEGFECDILNASDLLTEDDELSSRS